MTTRYWDDLELLFERLLSSSTGERSLELEKLRRTEPKMAEELHELLAAAGRASDDLDQLPSLPEDHEEETADNGLVGQPVGPYEVVRLLGEGGMGVVYEARRADGLFERNVAIKFLHTSIREARARRRFVEEASLLALLDHPRIVSLLDAGVHADRPYLVMELVRGVDMARHVRDARLSNRELVDLVLPLCGAVQAAHQSLVLHLDLKPSNVIVTSTGSPKLVDFGVARIMGGDLGDGLRPLTPAYASPEQLRGESLTTSSDVYSLGRILKTLLPHPDGDADLDAILERATSENADERYPSVERFSTDLQRWCTRMPVEARPLPGLVRGWRWVLRNVTLSATLLIAIGTTAWALHSSRRSLEMARANEVLGWQAHAQALRFAGLLERTLLSLPNDEASSDLVDRLEAEAESTFASWGDQAEALGRSHEALARAQLRMGRRDSARRHAEQALQWAQGDPGFDGNDLQRLRDLLETLSP